jgi:hypothetical protein
MKPETRERLKAEGRTPLTCAHSTNLRGDPLTLPITISKDGIQVWCQRCHRNHDFSRQILMQAWDELDRQIVAHEIVQEVNEKIG